MDRNSLTTELEARAAELWRVNPYPSSDDFRPRFTRRLFQYCRSHFGKKIPAPPIFFQIIDVAEWYYDIEQVDKIAFTPGFTSSDTVERGRYRDYLLKIIEIGERDADAWISIWMERFLLIVGEFVKGLPPELMVDKIDPDVEYDETGTAPSLLPHIERVGAVVDAMIVRACIVRSDHSSGVFDAIRSQLLELYKRVQGKGEITTPETYTGPPKEIVNRFLGEGSAFASLFHTPMPPLKKEEEPTEEEQPGEPVIDQRHWFEHSLLLARSGSGKTNAIRWRLAQLLPEIASGRASLILMEPKGDLIDEVLHYAGLWPMRDRVVILDPADASVSVNLFELPTDSSAAAFNETIDRISRVLNTITLDMTELQRQTLTLAMRAMYAGGQPSMRALMTILRQGKKALDLSALPFSVADYFEHDFSDSSGRLIIARLNALLANPIFETLFAGEHTTFDMLDEINAGKLIVINAGRAPPIYGRFWIEEIARCMRPRMAMPEHARTPTYLIIDEASQYVADDPHFAQMLDMARGARIGLLIAHQHMEQITSPHVRNSLFTNTALKFVASTIGDIFNLCRSMGTTEPGFLSTIPQYHFAFFGPNMTTAQLVRLPLVEFRERMSDQQYLQLRAENRRRYTRQSSSSPPSAVEQIAALSPIAAILETRRNLEDAVRGTVLALSLPDCSPDMTMLAMIQALQQHQIIDRDIREQLHQLRLFGNDAAHNRDAATLTKEAAVQFQQAADQIVTLLQSQVSKTPLQKALPEPQHQRDFDTDWKG